MKRRTTAMMAIVLLAAVSGGQTQGAFSAFARITPDTEERYDVYVQILPVEGQDGKYKVLPPQGPEYKNNYLIICKEQVHPEKQNFRPYLWSRVQERTDILSLVPLLPPGQHYPGNMPYVVAPKPAHVILDKGVLRRSYIYIDHPTPVVDGGYYYCIDLAAYPLPEDRKATIRHSPAEGIGPERGVMRRDPSDIVRVADLYYVWYTKSRVAHGYDATVWCATSHDGRTWTERDEALPQGPEGSWDAQSVFTPNILIAEGKYWLFYTGVPAPFNNKGNRVTKSAIGVAVADSPDGPWQKLPANPVLKCSDYPGDFDSMRVDDSCLILRDGKYWLYYKGRQWDNTPTNTMMGVAIAEEPEGPYVKYVANPVVPGGHEVLVWPLGTGVAAMINIGPERVRKTVQYAADGLTFSKMQDLETVPRAPGAYRPEAFTDNGRGRMVEWGIHIGSKKGFLPFLERFDYQW